MSICYFHIDNDGMASAAIVRLFDPNVYCIPVNYGYTLHKDKIKKGEKVYVVDFSFEPEDMKWLADNTELVWIDHHDTSLDAILPVVGDKITGIQKTGFSGCELAWSYFFPEQATPRAVSLIGRYDVWDHDAMLHIVEFDRGLSTYDKFPVNSNPGVFEFWFRLFRDDDNLVDRIIEVGTGIWEREYENNRRTINSMGFVADFHGYKAYVVNVGIIDSYLFASLDNKEQYDLFLGFYRHAKGHWKVSLREIPNKPVTHLGQLAAKHYAGGGGHAGAAGFSVSSIKDLPFFDML